MHWLHLLTLLKLLLHLLALLFQLLLLSALSVPSLFRFFDIASSTSFCSMACFCCSGVSFDAPPESCTSDCSVRPFLLCDRLRDLLRTSSRRPLSRLPCGDLLRDLLRDLSADLLRRPRLDTSLAGSGLRPLRSFSLSSPRLPRRSLFLSASRSRLRCSALSLSFSF